MHCFFLKDLLISTPPSMSTECGNQQPTSEPSTFTRITIPLRTNLPHTTGFGNQLYNTEPIIWPITNLNENKVENQTTPNVPLLDLNSLTNAGSMSLAAIEEARSWHRSPMFNSIPTSKIGRAHV